MDGLIQTIEHLRDLQGYTKKQTEREAYLNDLISLINEDDDVATNDCRTAIKLLLRSAHSAPEVFEYNLLITAMLVIKVELGRLSLPKEEFKETQTENN